MIYYQIGKMKERLANLRHVVVLGPEKGDYKEAFMIIGDLRKNLQEIENELVSKSLGETY